ncbi:MAG: hypothetical protein ACPG21_03225 [Crocinitomicaceae bacterium]
MELRYVYILGLIFSSLTLFGQEPDRDEGGVLMRRDFIAGLNFNTNAGSTGWGVAFEYAIQKNYKYRNTYGFTLTNIRHPKEFKIYSNLSSRGYFYGKMNSLVCFRPTYGGKRTLFRSERENGIEVTAKWSLGPSFGLVKPVYVRIDVGNTTLEQRYDPSVHNKENITARASWGKGFGESTVEIGAFAKAGVDFNFSNTKNKISGGELGIMADYFATNPVLLLDQNDPQRYFVSLYLQFNLGQKLY